jgi:tryptophan halogenase
MKKTVRSVLIVGGGSSGWMTAAAMIKQLPNTKITLVESANTPTIGVGESTIGHINEFFHFLDLRDEDWMPACNATYKTSIKFIDFRENPKETPHVFHYPFGKFDQTDKQHGIIGWFINAAKRKLDPYTFATYFHDHVLMADQLKMTRNKDFKIRGFRFDTDTAYHMDAALFGNYLRDSICLPGGLTHILDDVVDVVVGEDGIDHVVTKNGKLEADLYIDCTGFKSLLLEQALNTTFVSFSDTLLNDSAIATIIPYIDIEREMTSVTSCTAIESGWVWNIPLFNRMGTGYVYSSKFATKEQAEQQFRQHLKSNRMICPDANRAAAAELRHIKIKHGVHKYAWNKNCVGVGLANGFIEPLESTGLMLTHEAIIKLVNALKMRDGRVTRFDVDSFNFAFYQQILDFKDFISQHYALSMRNDTPYWQAVSEGITYSTKMLEHITDPREGYADLAFRNYRSRTYDHNMSGIVYIAAGMGYNPMDSYHVDFLNNQYNEDPGLAEQQWDNWVIHRDEVLEYIKTLPSHYEFLKKEIYKIE